MGNGITNYMKRAKVIRLFVILGIFFIISYFSSVSEYERNSMIVISDILKSESLAIEIINGNIKLWDYSEAPDSEAPDSYVVVPDSRVVVVALDFYPVLCSCKFVLKR